MVTHEGLRKDRKKAGVYCIFNAANGRRYVGSTNNLWRRFWEHRRHLRSGVHANRFLQNDYIKLGSDFFLFFVLQECQPDIRIEVEQHWLDLMWSDRQSCYNLEATASGRTTWSPSEETKKRMSLAKKGKSTGPCSDLRKEAIRSAKLGKPVAHSAEGKQRMIVSKQKTYNVRLVSPEGVTYGPITNLHAFCREHKLDRASTLRVIKGQQGHVKGWRQVGEDYKTRKRK